MAGTKISKLLMGGVIFMTILSFGGLMTLAQVDEADWAESDACVDCHADIGESFLDTRHGTYFAGDAMPEMGSCQTCHGPGGRSPRRPGSRLPRLRIRRRSPGRPLARRRRARSRACRLRTRRCGRRPATPRRGAPGRRCCWACPARRGVVWPGAHDARRTAAGCPAGCVHPRCTDGRAPRG